MRRVSDEFKQMAVQKLISRGSGSVQRRALAAELGVGESTLYKWAIEYGKPVEMDSKTNSKGAAKAWNSSAKLKAVLEYEALNSDKKGAFLREKGLYKEQVEAWSESVHGALDKPTGRKKLSQETLELRSEKKALIRDLRKKDKALAEVTALLVLKKKAEILWGNGDDE